MSAIFLRTRSQVSGTAAGGTESFIWKKTWDSPGFE